MKAAKEDVPEIAGDKKLSKRIEAFLGNKKSTEAVILNRFRPISSS
jgi:hypothetical protein